MPKLSSRSREVAERIAAQQPFETYGALRAVNGFIGPGKLPDLGADHRYSLRTAAYVVYSYDTPIAWWTPGIGWTVPNVRYSRTTSGHQGKLYLIDGTVHRPTPADALMARDGVARVDASVPGQGMAANMYGTY